MPLSDEVRERLRLHALKNQGRSTLMGLDRTLAGAALDNVQDRDGELTTWVLRCDGYLEKRLVGDWMTISEVRTVRAPEEKNGRPYGTRCEWVRLSYAPEWLKVDIAARWPSRRISYWARDKQMYDWALPLSQMCEFLTFCWPAYQDFSPRARKYLTGYTERYVLQNPGQGALLFFPDDGPVRGPLAVTRVADAVMDCTDSEGQRLQIPRTPRGWVRVGVDRPVE